MSRLSHRVRSQAERGEAEHPGDAGFVAAVEGSLGYLETIPEEFSFSYRYEESPPSGATPNEVLHMVLDGIRGWLGFLLYSTAYEVRHLANGIVTGLNEGDYIRVCAAARGLMEHSAVLNEAYTEIDARAENLRDSTSRTMDRASVEALVEILRASLKFAQATRFNWVAGVRGDLDAFYTAPDSETPTTNVMTLLEKLPQVEHGSAVWFYKMLCDFVHPNVASHMLCADNIERGNDDTMSYDLKYKPLSNEALGDVLHVVGIPVRDSLGLMQGQLAALQNLHASVEELMNLGGE